MNLIDRIVSYVSPQAGMRRQYARRLLASGSRAYAGATVSRGRDGWRAAGTAANAEIRTSMVALRDRARELVRDEPLAKKIVDLWELHLVGDGITLDFVSGKKALDDRQRELWLQWFETRQCDADGQLDGYGLQALAVRIMVEAGEVLIRLRRRDTSSANYRHLAVPLQLQVLEPDYLDHTRNGINADNGNPISMGIEFDKSNPSIRRAYWLFTEHPGDTQLLPGKRQSIRIPASEIIHMFEKVRNQDRGVTWLHAVITTLRDRGDYLEALLMKAKIEACFTLLIRNEETNGPPGSAGAAGGHGEERLEEVEPGMVRYLNRGEMAEAFDPGNSSGHTMLNQTYVRETAVGSGLTYDQLYSDLTGANYSSLRAGKMEFQSTVSKRQWHTVIPQMVEPIAAAFVQAGRLANHWPTDEHRVEVQPPKAHFVDPSKDGDAEVTELENGLKTMAEALKARGHSPKRFLATLEAEVKEWDAKGLVHPAAKPKEPQSAKPAPKAKKAPEKEEAA